MNSPLYLFVRSIGEDPGGLEKLKVLTETVTTALLIVKICLSQNYIGFSVKTQVLYFFNNLLISQFPWIMPTLGLKYFNVNDEIGQLKVINAMLGLALLGLMFLFKNTYERKYDTCWLSLVIAVSVVIGVLLVSTQPRGTLVFELMLGLANTCFALGYLAIFPQIYLVDKSERVDVFVTLYTVVASFPNFEFCRRGLNFAFNYHGIKYTQLFYFLCFVFVLPYCYYLLTIVWNLTVPKPVNTMLLDPDLIAVLCKDGIGKETCVNTAATTDNDNTNTGKKSDAFTSDELKKNVKIFIQRF